MAKMTLEQRRERAQERKESKARSEAAQAEVRRVVASKCCPQCGRGLKRNLALTGWWQCEQYGSVGFRKDSNAPACSWQGFTE